MAPRVDRPCPKEGPRLGVSVQPHPSRLRDTQTAALVAGEATLMFPGRAPARAVPRGLPFLVTCGLCQGSSGARGRKWSRGHLTPAVTGGRPSRRAHPGSRHFQGSILTNK